MRVYSREGQEEWEWIEDLEVEISISRGIVQRPVASQFKVEQKLLRHWASIPSLCLLSFYFAFFCDPFIYSKSFETDT